MTHKDIDKPEKDMMKSSMTEGIVRLPEVVLPDEALPFDIYALYRALVEAEEYCETSKRWKEFPKVLEPSQESLIDRFYDQLLSRVDDILRGKYAKDNSPPPSPPIPPPSTANPASGVPLSTSAATTEQQPASSNRAGSKCLSTSSSRHCPVQLRFWTSSTKDRAPRGEATKRKSDLMLVAKGCMLDELYWWHCLVSKEIKYDEVADEDSSDQIWQAVKLIFRNQPNRMFVLGVKLVGTKMTLVYVDRSGMLVSSSFDIHEDPISFLRVVVGLVYVSDEYIGFDTSVSIDKEGRGHASLNGIKYSVEDVVYTKSGVFGRGTVCFKVTRGEGQSVTYALKDAWVDVSRAQKEVEILRELNKLNITHIPKIIDHAIVQNKGINNSTKNIRDAVEAASKDLPRDEQPKSHKFPDSGVVKENDDQASKPKGKGKGKGKKKVKAEKAKPSCVYYKFFAREQYRLLLWPFGRPLTDFRCLEELLLGIRDVVGAIEQLHNNKYLHRDVSINNVVLAIGDENPATQQDVEEFRKRLEGFLIDYDYAINVEKESPSALADRTGTVPFMAIEVLKTTENPKHHKYYHDLESLLYVLCWLCMISAGPGKYRKLSEYKDSKIYRWNIQAPTNEGMALVGSLKDAFTRNDENMKIEMEDSFNKYFDPILSCLYGLRKCLFPISLEADKDLYDMTKMTVQNLKNTTKPDEHRMFKAARLRLPLGDEDRDSKWVFEDVYSVIDETLRSLPMEHRLAAMAKDAPLPSIKEEDEDGEDVDEDEEDEDEDEEVEEVEKSAPTVDGTSLTRWDAHLRGAMNRVGMPSVPENLVDGGKGKAGPSRQTPPENTVLSDDGESPPSSPSPSFPRSASKRKSPLDDESLNDASLPNKRYRDCQSDPGVGDGEFLKFRMDQ
ncbi:hypothetical protein SCHPADRAFT_997111 [Schizopora paradoxa]|uniref:Protein kinase domain-containing protein n=1 Tax=Schizopora paradoxa TaxID=27342 RepID=A0A0H2SA95_9AGAM|nr:hypothetical protein SCHPADRAFT_997111 [Schizopora paradoxa]